MVNYFSKICNITSAVIGICGFLSGLFMFGQSFFAGLATWVSTFILCLFIVFMGIVVNLLIEIRFVKSHSEKIDVQQVTNTKSENSDYWICECGFANKLNDLSCNNCFKKKK